MQSIPRIAGRVGTNVLTIKPPRIGEPYVRLITESPLRRIKTKKQHRAALATYERLSLHPIDASTREYFDVLVIMIEEYERKFQALLGMDDLTARDLIEHRLEARGMSVNAFSKEVGVAQSALSEMLNGKRGWSKSAIIKISKYLRINPGIFLK